MQLFCVDIIMQSDSQLWKGIEFEFLRIELEVIVLWMHYVSLSAHEHASIPLFSIQTFQIAPRYPWMCNIYHAVN